MRLVLAGALLPFLSPAAVTQGKSGETTRPWVLIASVSMEHDRWPEMLGRAYGSILMLGGGSRTYGMFARRGHLWEAREALKEASRKHHIGVILGPWPPDGKGESTVWEDGRITRRFTN